MKTWRMPNNLYANSCDCRVGPVLRRQYKVMRAVYARKGSLMSAPQYLNSIPRIYNLGADPKEEYVISGGPEGITRSLVLKEVSLRLACKKSFEEFPNADYSYMK